MSDNYPVDGELRRQAARIEALEQAHAELAAKVEQIISKAGTDCDICEGRGWSINVPSQTMYPCTWCSGKGKVNIAAPAPDPVCANCGHGQGHHMGRTEFCTVDIARGARCSCRNFVPTAEPAPLDPVLVAIRDLYVLLGDDDDELQTKLRVKWGKVTKSGFWGCGDLHDNQIRSYGRDGAR